MRPAEVVALLDRHRSAARESQRLVSRVAGFDVVADIRDRYLDPECDIRVGDPLQVSFPPGVATFGLRDEAMRLLAHSTGLLSAVWEWWAAGGRQVIRFDADALAAVLDTPGDVVLPDDVFARLPFASFTVVLDGELQLSPSQWCQAFTFVARPILPSSLSADLLVISHERSGTVPAWSAGLPGAELGEAHLYLSGLAGATIDEAVAASMARVDLLLHADAQVGVGEMEAALRAAMFVGLYLTSPSADLVAVASSQRQVKAARKQGRRLPVVHDAGFRVGAALRAHRRTEQGAPAGVSGRTVSPHIRRAHWHTVAFGAGRSERRLEWFPPIPVRAAFADEQPTVRDVGAR